MTAQRENGNRGSEGGGSGSGQGLSVANPDEYNNQRRLRQIHNAREDFVEIRREARSKFNPTDTRQSEITRHRYHEIVSNALIDYLLEVEPVVMTAEHQTRAQGEDDEEDEDDEEETSIWTDQEIAEAPDGSSLTLASIVENDGQMPTEDDEDIPLDIRTSRQAFRHANRFLASVGLGLELDQTGLPMIRGFDPSTGAEPGIDNAEMKGDPEL